VIELCLQPSFPIFEKALQNQSSALHLIGKNGKQAKGNKPRKTKNNIIKIL